MVATNRKRRSRTRETVGGVPEIVYQFFGPGPFFEAAYWEQETTRAERKTLWERYRQEILDRYRAEGNDDQAWGEILENLKGAGCERET
jgi:hypothetical protein